MNKRNHLIFCLIFILSWAAFFFIKFFGPTAIEILYKHPSFDILNKIVGITDVRPLDYYLGEIEIALLGPLKSMISGGIFLAFCLIYLRGATTFQFGLAVFIYFLTTRFEVLFNPPFGEGITGPFSDAIWLVQNKLDYIGLLHQDTVMTGGPQIYPTSLYTLILAILMTLIPSTTTFLTIMHILIFAMAATTIALLRKISLKAFGPEIANATVILLLSLPLYQSMSELINLEMPSLFFTMACAYFLTEKKIVAASLMALCSLFTKDPGIIACIAVAIVSSKLYFEEPLRQKRFEILWPVITVIVITTIKTIIRSIIIGEQKVYAMVCFLCGWQNLRISPWFWGYAVMLAMLCFQIFRWYQSERKAAPQNTLVTAFFKEYFDVLIMFLMTGLWFLLFTNFLTLAYRYQLLLLPFIIFCISYSILQIVKSEKITVWVIIAATMFSFFCSHGFMYDNERFTDCVPTHLERSLEYRNFLKLERTLAKEIENNYSSKSIVAPFQTAQLLLIPKLGYVQKPLDVTVYGMRATLGLKPYVGLSDFDLLNTIWVGYPHHQLENIPFPYPIDPRDKVLKELQVGHIKVDIFMGGFAVEKMRRLVELWQRGLINKPH